MGCDEKVKLKPKNQNFLLTQCITGLKIVERPPPKVAPVGVTPGGVLLRENRMYGCENSVHKETPCVAL